MNQLRENLIFVFFAVCFAVCGVFWVQLSRIPERQGFTLPTYAPDTQEASRVQQLLTLADRMIKTTQVVKERESHRLARNPFTLPEPDQPVVVDIERPDLPQLKLSSISWSDTLPLTIINGEILTQGESIPDLDIRIRRIHPEFVTLMYKGFEYKIHPRQSREGG